MMHDDGWPRSHGAGTPAEAQTALVLEEYGNYVEPGPPDWRETGGIRYFVRRGFVLARDEVADRARAILAAAGLLPPDDAERMAPLHPGPSRRPEEPRDGDAFHGLRYLRLGADHSVFEALRVLRQGLDRDGRRAYEPLSPGDVGPEHLLHLTDHTGVCPADEPGHVPPHTPPDPPPTAEHRAGEGIRILVVDTGLDPQAAAKPWLAGVTGDPDPGVAGGAIERYAGHGTFIAGVIRTVAPAAEVIVRAGLPGSLFGPATNPPGTAFERELAASLEHALVHDHPDVISLSAGTLTDDPALLMVLDAFHDRVLHRYMGVVLVAGAGN
jgi:hypothetical protein